MTPKVHGGAVVLLSGGLDSTVLLYKMVAEFGKNSVIALTVFYGQKHHKELEYAAYHCKQLGIKQIIMDLSKAYSFDENCALLTRTNVDLPEGTYAEQLESQGSVLSTYVPFRNGLFLAYATAIALQHGLRHVAIATHQDDSGAAYPDCGIHFLNTIGEAIYLGTGEAISIYKPFAELTKADIAQEGHDLGVDLDKTWSCYAGGEYPCGVCSTCLDREKAIQVINR